MTNTTNTTTTTKRPTTLTDLPPELWAQIVDYLPTASSIASLGRTNKNLHAFAEKDAWKAFARNRFPTTCPPDSPSFKDTARTLTTLSKAWDKRAFVARYLEPRGDITAFPGRKKSTSWKRPRGQTIGFTPQLDVYEQIVQTWQEREEVLAFSAGAEICVRNTTRATGRDNVRWTTYRPLSAHEGRDDVTSLHLLRPDAQGDDGKQNLVFGTANGELQLVSLPDPEDEYDQDVRITYFATQGLPVRSSSLLQEPFHPTLLATNLGDARIALYQVDPEQSKICASSQFDMKPMLRSDGNPMPNHKAWTTEFLSPSMLAVGTGPVEESLHIYSITGSGLDRDAVRKLCPSADENLLSGKTSLSTIYSVAPLPAGIGSRGDGNVFVTGTYGGVIRLYDLRSDRSSEQTFAEPVDDSPIYSLLPRGREKLVAGTGRHNLVKVYDLRLGAKCYNHSEACKPNEVPADSPVNADNDFNIFLRPNNPAFTSRATGYDRRRNVESSVYNLASPSPDSPFIYAGVENAIMSLAFTELLDPHPDTVYFEPWTSAGEKNGAITHRTFESRDVLSLAMYDQGASMKLCVQRSPWETWRACQPKAGKRAHKLIDERWKGANEFGP